MSQATREHVREGMALMGGDSGYERTLETNLAKRQQDFDIAERRARLVLEMAREFGTDRYEGGVVPVEVLRHALDALMAVE